ncbi:MAG: hypothetical protein PHU51_03735 [Candidatus Nanoarchaeia archaeon]|nr:hypothetical protein [Candidatus Nanoarchaeia archaeon]
MKLMPLILLLLLIPLVSGATITGTIYDLSFNKVSTAVVSINTDPIQTMVPQNGKYSFTVPPGEYLIEAKQYDSGIITSEISQDITFSQEGTYNLDLMLYPITQIEELEQLDNYTNIFEETETTNLIPIYIILFLLIIITSYYFITKKTKSTPFEDQLENNILLFIEEQKTTSQLDIRTKFPQFSEAKISLIIKKLESEEKIKKIKHGRANIISLK